MKSEPLRLQVWTDGSRTGYGVVIEDDAGNTLRRLAGSAPPDAEDHSDTEYLAVILGLREARDLGASTVLVFCDSKFVVDQMKGKANVNARMAPYYVKAVEATREVVTDFEPVEGKTNKADGLSKALARIPKSPT
jgi:ribonuclease HI